MVSAAVVGLDPPPVPLGRCQRPNSAAGAHGGPVLVQVGGERRPDAGQVVGVGRVEADALGVAEEVVVEHRDQLAGRQRPRLGEERAGERLEQHRLGAVRHAQAGQELRGRHVVEPGGGPLAVVGQQFGGQPGVGAEQVAQAQAGGPGEQRQQVQRRRRRQAGEVLGRPGARQHRVAADRPQEAQLRVEPAQHRPPRVVVPEERVEAVLDDLVGPVRQRVRPGAEPAAEGRRGLQQGDRDPALGEHHGRADPGDPAADDDGLGAVRQRRGAAAGRRRRRRGAASAAGAAREVSEGEPSTPSRLGACRRPRAPTRRAPERGPRTGIVRRKPCLHPRAGAECAGGRRVAADMTVELGRIGIWRRRDQLTPRLAREVEALGYGAIWIGGSPPADLFLAEELLDATDRLAVATGIVNMWSAPADGGRGVPPPDRRRAPRPLPARRRHRPPRGHPGVPQPLRHDRRLPRRPRRRGGARRGPGAGRARPEGAARSPPSAPPARTRTSPPPTTPGRPARSSATGRCSRRSRRWCSTPTRSPPGRSGRPAVDRPYLHLRNYTSNLKRLGWTDADLADGGSDALIDALAVHGDAATVAAGVTAHLDAGADHVCIQLLTAAGADPLPGLRALAEALEL